MTEANYVVRVSSESWFDGRNLNVKKKIAVLKKQSPDGGDPIKDECEMAGADDTWPLLIPDLNIQDGLYTLTARYFRDCESGMVDDVDYSLTEIKEPTND